MDTKGSVEERLREVMAAFGWTPAALARECNVTRQRVNAWLNKGARPEAEALRQLLRRRRIDPMWILFGDGRMFAPPPLSQKQQDLLDLVVSLPDADAAACLAFLRAFRGSEPEST